VRRGDDVNSSVGKTGEAAMRAATRREAALGGLAVLGLAGGVLGRPGTAAAAIDQLQLFVPAAPGGGWDQTARTMEAVLRGAAMVKGVQISNVPGAGGTVGLPQFVNQWKGRPNALMVGGMVMVGAVIANKAPVGLQATTPIARLTGEFEAIVVPAASPHKDMASLVAAMKANPGSVSWAGGSAGGTDHILVGLIAKAAGVDPRAASYVAFAGGGAAQAAILGNQVTAGVSGWGEFAEQVKAGKMRALAISADRRQPGIDVPTLKEQGLDVELFNWRGVFAPPSLKPEEVKALVTLVEAMAATEGWKAELAKREWTGILLTGEPFAAFLAAEIVRIEGILKSLGLA
jgi:putative tricarboxylic transport membrane protein